MTPASRLFLAGLIASLLLFSYRLNAQQAVLPNAPQPKWNNVQALSFGAPIIVRSGSGDVSCNFKSAGADSLSCIAKKGDLSLRQGDVRRVETYNHGASTAVMAGVGAGVGIVTVKAVSAALGFHGWAKGSVYAGGAGIGAVTFGSIGYFSHPIHHTIYKAPQP